MKIRTKDGEVLANSIAAPVMVCYAIGFGVVMAPLVIVLIFLTIFGYPDPEVATGMTRVRGVVALLFYWIVFSLSPALMAGGFVTLGLAILKVRGKKIEIGES